MVFNSLWRIGPTFLACSRSSQALRQLLAPAHLAPVTCVGISGKIMRDPDEKRPPPFPYKERPFRVWDSVFDNTKFRFNENSKVVVVDGPISAGKTKFVQELAEELDMIAYPEVSMDLMYINDYGYDLRQLDPQLPESCKSCDAETFYRDPHNRNVPGFQLYMYQLRFHQYTEALAHLFNTGQGVILERSAYSDFVFVEAMHKCGYLGKNFCRYYNEVKTATIVELLHPHLVIYLDVPVPVIMERIRKRNVPYEVNSEVFKGEYLSAMEYFYKQHYLKEISNHSEVLVYDWSNFGETEIVVEDIEHIDLDGYKRRGLSLRDWRIRDRAQWTQLRRKYTNHRGRLLSYFNVPCYDVPEIIIPAADLYTFTNIVDSAYGQMYEKGFNAAAGDTGIFFKTHISHWNRGRPALPRTP